MLPDDIFRPRLALVRYLHRLAVDQSRQPEPQRGLSILMLHDSIELFLQLAAEHREARVNENTPFLQYWDALGGASPPYQLGRRESMRRLNRARTSLKHHGTLPSPRDVGDFCDMTTAFLEESTSLLFELDFSSVSLIDLIASPEVRSLLEDVTRFLDAGRVVEALEGAAVAFTELLDDYERGYRSAFGVHPFDSPIVLRSGLYSIQDFALKGFASDVERAIDGLRTVTEILALGLDYHRYARFRALTPLIERIIGGGFVLVEREYEPAPTTAEARSCQSFVIDSALRLQEIGTPLLSPQRVRPPLQRQPRAIGRVEISKPPPPPPD